jgi:hypothetical protein
VLGKPKAPKEPKASKSSKPLKRSTYFGATALVALVVSGALAYFLTQPQWRTGFSYQYTPTLSKSLTSGEDKSFTSVVDSTTDPVMTQVEILRSDRFLEEVQSGLDAQGISGWTTESIAQALTITNPSRSNLVQVVVRTPRRDATMAIAGTLDKAYLEYVAKVQKDTLEAEREFVESSLKNINSKLIEGDTSLHDVLASDPQLKDTAFTTDPMWGEKTLTQNYEDVTRKMREVENEIALDGTTLSHYKALLNKDEKTLLEGVILGEDPVLQKITDQIASAETDANILSVKYSPGASEIADTAAKVRTLQKLYDTQRQKILGGNGKPVIRDALRRNLIEEMIASKIKVESNIKLYQVLNKQRDNLLSHLDHVASTVGDYNAWNLQKTMLQNTRNSLEKRLDDLNYQLKSMPLPVKVFRPIPQAPSPEQNMPQAAMLFFASFSGLFLLMSAVPFVMDYQSNQIPTRAVLGILKDLLKVKGQQIILMLPVYSSGHLNASTHLGGLLNQFGRDALVMDVDLAHRLLSRKIPLEHPNGVFEHLLSPEMKKPYLDPLSGAKILPLEATLEADKVVEYSQIIQRLPRIWSRWSSSIVILDISQWHEAYHQLLPYVSQVIFYIPPTHQASILLPKIFKGKYNVPVSLVEIQPEA